jgi:release factor glutamine methyltransferase
MDVWGVNRIAQAIEARSIAVDREAYSLAQWVWEDILEKGRGSHLPLAQYELDLMESALERLASGEPVQYIAGHAYFYGKKFKVSPSVLIPRPETEELVEWVFTTYRDESRPLRILDIGTGSACIAIMIKLLLGDRAEVTGIDISPEALSIAEYNSKITHAEVTFLLHDFLDKRFTSLGIFDIIISNPPYISKAASNPAIIDGLKFEPDLALFPAGDDPDVFYRRIIFEAGDVLSEKGACFMEINEFRKEAIQDMLCQSQGWTGITFRKDLQGAWRMLRLVRNT